MVKVKGQVLRRSRRILSKRNRNPNEGPILRARESKKNDTNNSKSNEGNVEKLPVDIAQEIFSRLPLNYLFRSRYACKSWRLLINHTRVSLLHYIHTSTRNPKPTSLILWTNKIRNPLYYILDIDTCDEAIKLHKPSLVSYLQKFYIVASLHGFLFLADQIQSRLNARKFVVSNPVTGDWIKLPPPPIITRPYVFEICNHIGFGHTPKSNLYKVIRILTLDSYLTTVMDDNFFKKQPTVMIDILTLGSNSWRTIGPIELKYNLFWEGTCGVFVNGYTHWLALDERRYVIGIHAFNVEEERMEMISVPHSVRGRMKYLYPVLGALDGFLILVDAQGMAESFTKIWVMRDHGVEDSWTVAFTILCVDPIVNFKPLKVLENGNLLLRWKSGKLASHDPKTGTNEMLRVDGLPYFIGEVPRVGTLVKLKDAIATQGP